MTLLVAPDYGTVMRVRTSERKDFMRCRQKWWWAYVDRLQPKERKFALGFGDLIHQALAIYYPPGVKRGPHPIEPFRELWAKHGEGLYGMRDDEEEWVHGKELGEEMLVGYVEHYGPEPDLEIIAPEQSFQIIIEDSETGAILCEYVGQMDAVARVKIGDKYWIVLLEHKTTKSIPNTNIYLALDEQASSYWTYGPDWMRDQGILGPKEDLDGVLFNHLRKAKPDLRDQDAQGRYLNKDGSVSKKQPAPLYLREPVRRTAAQRANTMRRVEWQVWEMAGAKEGLVPIYKHPTGDCRWDCQFKHLCELHELGADWEDYKDAMFTVWDPYAAHELEAEARK